MRLAPALFASVAMSTAQAQSVPEHPQPAAPATQSRVVPYRYQTQPMPARATQHHADFWGLDSLAVEAVRSGEVIRFGYRVLDPYKANALKGRHASLIDPGAGVRLTVLPEKVAGSAQGSPEAGEVVWVAFSNPARAVKPGHRVSVTIGQFRADGLVVR